jgi:hypothetical protein
MSTTAPINAAQKVDVRDECAPLAAVQTCPALGRRKAAPPSGARHTVRARSGTKLALLQESSGRGHRDDG